MTPSWRTFPRTATYRMGAQGRCAGLGGAAFLLAVAAFVSPFAFEAPPRLSAGEIGRFVLIVVVFGAAASALAAYALNKRFVLRPDSVASHGLGAPVTLPFSRLEAATIRRARRGGTWYTVTLHATHGSAGPTLSVEEFHLRDDALFAWLRALPKRGGDVLDAPAPARTTAFQAATYVVMFIPALAGLAFLASQDIGTARDMVQGYPPLASLSVVRGAVVQAGPCARVGRNHWQVDVVVDDGVAARQEALDCRFEEPLRALPGPHTLAIWRDRRPFSDGGIRQVEIDGRVLESYEAELFSRRLFDPARLAGMTLLLVALVLVFGGFVASFRERAPSEG